MFPRSLLFVPGNRSDRFDKARLAGADLTCIDLEDAVAPADRAAARVAVANYLAGLLPDARARVGVRLNAFDTRDGLRDVGAVAGGLDAGFLMIAKAQDAGTLRALSAALDGAVPLWPVLETPRGIRVAAAIARVPGVAGLLFGGADLAAALGTSLEWEPLLHARQSIVAAAAEVGVATLDVPETVLNDDGRLLEGSRRVRQLGFTGRACIHPRQIAVVHHAFAWTEPEIASARRIVKAFEASDGGAARLDGVLLERPLFAAAQRVLKAAERPQEGM